MSEVPQRSGLAAKFFAQFHRPQGVVGHLVAWILATRSSNQQRNLWTVDLLDVQPRDRVLEVGCGPGFAMHALCERASQGFVAGVDHSATILSHARRRNRAAIDAGRAQLFEASLEALPDFAEPFDKVMAVNVLMFSDDGEQVLRDLRARMRLGGRIAVTHQPRKPGASNADAVASAEALAKQLLAGGFGNARIETLPLEPVCAACVLAEAV